MHNLAKLGFDALEVEPTDPSRIARVSAEFGDRFEVVGEQLHRSQVSLAGGLRDNRPAVGDFVELDAGGLRIDRVFPHRTALVRQAAGLTTREQVIAANVDVVFIVTSMNDEFNESRLERYLAVVWESGATPVVLLNKADLADDPGEFLDRARQCAFGVDVIAMSALDGASVAPLDAYLGEGRTFVFVGSSGVGKSTIVNAVIGSEQQATSAIREDDDEGRHTTTRRDLILLERDRGILIDTPGMRELQLWDAHEGVSTTFADVEAFAASCRFRDCQHDDEPGCGVRAAVESGELDERRFQNYQKLQRELAFHDRKRNAAATRAENRRWAQMIRNAKKTRW